MMKLCSFISIQMIMGILMILKWWTILIETNENTTQFPAKDLQCMRMTVLLSLSALGNGSLRETHIITLKNSAFSRNLSDGSSFECGKRQLNSKIEWKLHRNLKKSSLFLTMISEKRFSRTETTVWKWKTSALSTSGQAWRRRALPTSGVSSRRNARLSRRRSQSCQRSAETMWEMASTMFCINFGQESHRKSRWMMKRKRTFQCKVLSIPIWSKKVRSQFSKSFNSQKTEWHTDTDRV